MADLIKVTVEYEVASMVDVDALISCATRPDLDDVDYRLQPLSGHMTTATHRVSWKTDL